MARRRGKRRHNIPDGLPIDPRKAVSDPNFRPVDPAKARIGWRAWSVQKDLPPYGNPVKLYSATWDYWWPAKQKAEAECSACGQPDGVGVPGESCSCGFYSAKTLKHLMHMGYHTYYAEDKMFKVVGRVGCWGKIIEATSGWKAQYAYPIELLVPYEAGFDFARRIRDDYGCKVRLANFLVQPHEITDEAIQAILDGKPQVLAVNREQTKQRGRRVTHKATSFRGTVAGEQYEYQGLRVIDVVYDVTPERKVRTEVANLAWVPVR